MQRLYWQIRKVGVKMRGGARPGAGRPAGWRKENPLQREVRTLRAFNDEWQVIKDFVKLLRSKGVEQTKKIIEDVK